MPLHIFAVKLLKRHDPAPRGLLLCRVGMDWPAWWINYVQRVLFMIIFVYLQIIKVRGSSYLHLRENPQHLNRQVVLSFYTI